MLEVSESTLYPVLRRLKKDGCLEVYDKQYGGRNRRYYKITSVGIAQLSLYKEEWKQYSQRISGISKEEREYEPGGVLKEIVFLLKDLPEEEIEDAIAYYEDYFEEAGEEKEEQVIKELGSPEKIARMIRDSVQGNQASSEYTEEGYRQETYEDYQQMSRKDSQKEAKTGQQSDMKGRRNRNIILMILILVFVGSWLIPGIFGIVIGIAGGIFGSCVGLLFGGTWTGRCWNL